jgi:hypothetical protein
MVIGNFNELGIFVLPHKANSILVIYPNRVLTLSIALQRVQSKTISYSQIIEGFDSRQEGQSLASNFVQPRRQSLS